MKIRDCLRVIGFVVICFHLAPIVVRIVAGLLTCVYGRSAMEKRVVKINLFDMAAYSGGDLSKAYDYLRVKFKINLSDSEAYNMILAMMKELS